MLADLFPVCVVGECPRRAVYDEHIPYSGRSLCLQVDDEDTERDVGGLWGYRNTKLTKVIVSPSSTIHASEGKHLTKGIKLGKERQRMVTAGSRNH